MQKIKFYSLLLALVTNIFSMHKIGLNKPLEPFGFAKFQNIFKKSKNSAYSIAQSLQIPQQYEPQKQIYPVQAEGFALGGYNTIVFNRIRGNIGFAPNFFQVIVTRNYAFRSPQSFHQEIKTEVVLGPSTGTNSNLENTIKFETTEREEFKNFVEVSPDGSLILAAQLPGKTSKIYIYNGFRDRLESGLPEATNRLKYIIDQRSAMMNTPEFITSAHFSPDSARILTTGAGAQIWDATNGQLIERITTFQPVRSGQFSPNSQQIIASLHDGTIGIYDINSGSQVKTLSYNTPMINAQFSHDSSKIFTSSDDGKGQMWNAEGELLYTIPGHTKQITVAEFSPDNLILVTASYEDKSAKIWDTSTGGLIYSFQNNHPIVSATFIYSQKQKRLVQVDVYKKVLTFDLSNLLSQLLLKRYFSNKLLPLQDQALLVVLDTISKQHNGNPVKKSDLVEDMNVDTSLLFSSLPSDIKESLRVFYKIDDEVFKSKK